MAPAPASRPKPVVVIVDAQLPWSRRDLLAYGDQLDSCTRAVVEGRHLLWGPIPGLGAPDRVALANILALLRLSHRLELPVLLLENVIRHTSTGMVIPGLPIHPLVLHAAGPHAQRIVKDRFDAFEQESVAAYLASQRAEWLVLGGLHRDVCVYRTSLSAVRLGYSVATSPGLLMDAGRREADAPAADAFFKTRTTLFETLGGLAQHVRSLSAA